MFSRCRSSRCEESRVKNASSLLILVDAFIDCSGAIPKKQPLDLKERFCSESMANLDG